LRFCAFAFLVQNRGALNAMDARIFWWTMYVTPLLWIALGLIGVLKFELNWLIVVVIALALNGANLVGYFKCDREAAERLQDAVGASMMGAAMGSVAAALRGGGSGASGGLW